MSATVTYEEDDDGRVIGVSFACSRNARGAGVLRPAPSAETAQAAAAEKLLGAGDVRFSTGTQMSGVEWFTVSAAPDRLWKRFAVLYDTERGELVACECGEIGGAARTCDHAHAVAAWVEQRRRKVAWEAEHGPCPDGSGWE